MKKLAIYSALSFFAFTSCQKDPNPNTSQNGCVNNNTTSSIDSQDLLNCKYIQGTYWVYIDSVNLQSDSTYIDVVNSGYTSDMCNNSYEVHSFGTVSLPSQSTETYSVTPGGLYKNTSGINSGTLVYNGYSTANSSNNPVATYLDSFFVFDQYYYNVVQFTVDNDYSEGNKQSVYYINSDYGFLRHEIYDNSVLISNRILKNKQIVR